MMKKKRLLFGSLLMAIILPFGMASCGSDDPDPDAFDFNDKIAAGNWHIDSVDGFYDLKYFVLDSTFAGGSLNLGTDGHYTLTNGDRSFTQYGSWKSGRWYVVLTGNGLDPDTLNVMAPRNQNAANWATHLDLYKEQRVSRTEDASNPAIKRAVMYTTKVAR